MTLFQQVGASKHKLRAQYQLERCARSLKAYSLVDLDNVAASHFLMLCQSFRAFLALASDDLDDITNGLDDLAVVLQDLSLTSERTALLYVKITRQDPGANLERCRISLLANDFTSDRVQDISTLDRVHGDLKLLQQSPRHSSCRRMSGESPRQCWQCTHFLDGSPPDTLARDMGGSMTRHNLFAAEVAAARGALLKSEVVQTLHTTASQC